MASALYGCGGGSSSNSGDFANYTNEVIPDAVIEPAFSVSGTGDIATCRNEFQLLPNANVAEVTAVSTGSITKNTDGSFTYIYDGSCGYNTPDSKVDITYKNTDASTGVYELSLFSDPLYAQSWHLRNTGEKIQDSELSNIAGIDLNLEELPDLQDLNGRDITGEEIGVVVFDSAVDATNKDLSARIASFDDVNVSLAPMFNYSLTDANYVDSNEEMFQHGTAIAGIIGAEAGNHFGSRGIAPKVNLYSVFLPELSMYQSQNHGIKVQNYSEIALLQELAQHSSKYRVINTSWGRYGSMYSNDVESMYLESLTEDGVTLSVSSGNDFKKNTYNVELYEVTGHLPKNLVGPCVFLGVNCGIGSGPFGLYEDTIKSTAINSQGAISSYATQSAVNWIATPGGEYGLKGQLPGILTTDVSGCSAGFANRVSRNQDKYTDFNKGLTLDNASCSFTDIMNGSSASAAMTSGVLALMYQAYPKMNVWQARYILAQTARNDNDFSELSLNRLETKLLMPQDVGTNKEITWDNGWVENAAGLRFSSRYGFGLINGSKAVKLALSCESDSECALRKDAPLSAVAKADSCVLEETYGNGYGNVYLCSVSGFSDIDTEEKLLGNASIETVGFDVEGLKFVETVNDDESVNTYSDAEIKAELENTVIKDPVAFCHNGTLYFRESKNSNITHEKYQQKLPLQVNLESPHGTSSILKNYWSNFMGIQGVKSSDIAVKAAGDTGSYYFSTNAFYQEHTNLEKDTWTIRINSFCPLDVENLMSRPGLLKIKYYKR